jgi:hypothetical protein
MYLRAKDQSTAHLPHRAVLPGLTKGWDREVGSKEVAREQSGCSSEERMKRMYTGRLIDELIEKVQRAEEDAHIRRDEELIQQFLHAHMLDASYTFDHVGVA